MIFTITCAKLINMEKLQYRKKTNLIQSIKITQQPFRHNTSPTAVKPSHFLPNIYNKSVITIKKHRVINYKKSHTQQILSAKQGAIGLLLSAHNLQILTLFTFILAKIHQFFISLHLKTKTLTNN